MGRSPRSAATKRLPRVVRSGRTVNVTFRMSHGRRMRRIEKGNLHSYGFNQLLCGFTIKRALLYAIFNVRHVFAEYTESFNL